MFELVVRFNDSIVQLGDELEIKVDSNADTNDDSFEESAWLVKAISEDDNSMTVDWTHQDGSVLKDQIIKLDWWPSGTAEILKIDTKDLAKDPNLAFKLRRQRDDQ